MSETTSRVEAKAPAATLRTDQSVAKNLYFGEIVEENLFPYPQMRERDRELLAPMADAIDDFLAPLAHELKQWDKDAHQPEEFIQQLREMGLFSLIIPEEHGGLALSNAAYARVLAQTSRHDSSVSLTIGAHSSIGMKGVLLFGDDEQKARYLPRLASGEMIAAFCLTESGAGSDAASIRTTAKKNADGTWTLNGEKIWITNGGIAGLYTVFARTDSEAGKMTAFIVEAGWPGVAHGPHEDKMGIRASSTTTVSFADVIVPAENVLGGEGKGFKVAMSILNNGRTGLGGGAVGGMKTMIRLATAQAKDRKQFGKPIAEFGLIREKITQMMIDGYMNGRWQPRLVGHAGAGSNFVACDPNTGTLWALLGHGHWGAKLSRSTDEGASWSDAPQLKYPPGARYIGTDMPGEDGAEPPARIRTATLLKLWCIAFGPRGRIYVGTIPGGLFESDDGGEHFELNRALWNHESRGGDLFAGEGSGKTEWFGTPASESGEFAAGIHSIMVDPTNADRVLVAVSTAGVLESTDGGKSWRGRNTGMTNDYLPDPQAEWGHDPHFVALCPGQPQHLWQQNHCGVFYSDDGAAHWQNVSKPEQGVRFGFPVAVDAQDGRTAWLVPGHSDMQRTTIDGGLFVARTTDGGQSWQQLRDGLPQENAFDVVYRHALDVDLDGDTLAFGSTTGNLYLSEDRGDSWQTVGNNLPPIYSVRFG